MFFSSSQNHKQQGRNVDKRTSDALNMAQNNEPHRANLNHIT